MISIKILYDLDRNKVIDNFLALGRLRKMYPLVEDTEIIEAIDYWHKK